MTAPSWPSSARPIRRRSGRCSTSETSRRRWVRTRRGVLPHGSAPSHPPRRAVGQRPPRGGGGSGDDRPLAVQPGLTAAGAPREVGGARRRDRVVSLGLGMGLAVGLGGFGMHRGSPRVAAAVLAPWLLGLLFGSLALALGAATGRRGLAQGVSASLAIAAYLSSSLRRRWPGSACCGRPRPGITRSGWIPSPRASSRPISSCAPGSRSPSCSRALSSSTGATSRSRPDVATRCAASIGRGHLRTCGRRWPVRRRAGRRGGRCQLGGCH